MASVEESGLRRRPFLRQHRQLGGLFTLQMRQNPLDYRRVFNAGNDLDLPGAPLTGLNIDIKYPLAPPAPLSRSDTLTKLAVWCELT